MAPRTLFSAMAVVIAPALLGGCIAKTAVDVATAPVRVTGKAVDLATTSQSEADEKRGRELRRREERLGRLQREYERYEAQCLDGNRRACPRATELSAEIGALETAYQADPVD